ncbi:unnamed protein product [Amoebophrya sp. A25]|nr:unnamed protein product [Amoebophrya sp. A25]|eukprot:GSA25T00026479001.1
MKSIKGRDRDNYLEDDEDDGDGGQRRGMGHQSDALEGAGCSTRTRRRLDEDLENDLAININPGQDTEVRRIREQQEIEAEYDREKTQKKLLQDQDVHLLLQLCPVVQSLMKPETSATLFQQMRGEKDGKLRKCVDGCYGSWRVLEEERQKLRVVSLGSTAFANTCAAGNEGARFSGTAVYSMDTVMDNLVASCEPLSMVGGPSGGGASSGRGRSASAAALGRSGSSGPGSFQTGGATASISSRGGGPGGLATRPAANSATMQAASTGDLHGGAISTRRSLRFSEIVDDGKAEERDPVDDHDQEVEDYQRTTLRASASTPALNNLPRTNNRRNVAGASSAQQQTHLAKELDDFDPLEPEVDSPRINRLKSPRPQPENPDDPEEVKRAEIEAEAQASDQRTQERRDDLTRRRMRPLSPRRVEASPEAKKEDENDGSRRGGGRNRAAFGGGGGGFHLTNGASTAYNRGNELIGGSSSSSCSNMMKTSSKDNDPPGVAPSPWARVMFCIRGGVLDEAFVLVLELGHEEMFFRFLDEVDFGKRKVDNYRSSSYSANNIATSRGTRNENDCPSCSAAVEIARAGALGGGRGGSRTTSKELQQGQLPRTDVAGDGVTDGPAEDERRLDLKLQEGLLNQNIRANKRYPKGTLVQNSSAKSFNRDTSAAGAFVDMDAVQKFENNAMNSSTTRMNNRLPSSNAVASKYPLARAQRRTIGAMLTQILKREVSRFSARMSRSRSAPSLASRSRRGLVHLDMGSLQQIDDVSRKKLESACRHLPTYVRDDAKTLHVVQQICLQGSELRDEQLQHLLRDLYAEVTPHV